MNLVIGNACLPRGQAFNRCRGNRGCSNATSAVAGGCCRGIPRSGILARTAQRDDVDETETKRATHKRSDAKPLAAAEATIARGLEPRTSPLSFKDPRRLPNLSCSSPNSASCVNIHFIDDPCQDDSLDLKIFEYMVELVRGGTTEERAAEVISQWSGGGGVGRVDLHKLRGYFMRTTLEEVARKHAAPAVMPFTLTCVSYWSLGLLPGTDEAVLPPAVRGALVAANLLLLVYFASRSLKSAGRVVRVGRAALDFSNQAELVLLALRDLAAGHGALVQATLGPAAPSWERSSGPSSSSSPGTSAAAFSGLLPAGVAAAAVAARRHASRQLVLQASAAAMRHAKRQARVATAVSAPLTALWTASASRPSSASASTSHAESPMSPLSPPQRERPPTCPATPAPSPSASPLSSLDSYLVLREAAAISDGFDAVSELGMSAEEAAAAAAMYSRYGDSSRGGRIGDYELRRLLQEAGVPPLSQEERRLVLLLHSREPPPAAGSHIPGAGSGGAGRGRGKGWLTFAEWAEWWAATPVE